MHLRNLKYIDEFIMKNLRLLLNIGATKLKLKGD